MSYRCPNTLPCITQKKLLGWKKGKARDALMTELKGCVNTEHSFYPTTDLKFVTDSLMKEDQWLADLLERFTDQQTEF